METLGGGGSGAANGMHVEALDGVLNHTQSTVEPPVLVRRDSRIFLVCRRVRRHRPPAESSIQPPQGCRYPRYSSDDSQGRSARRAVCPGHEADRASPPTTPRPFEAGALPPTPRCDRHAGSDAQPRLDAPTPTPGTHAPEWIAAYRRDTVRPERPQAPELALGAYVVSCSFSVMIRVPRVGCVAQV